MNKQIYLIGSLRNEQVPIIGNQLRAKGFNVFDNWHSAGENADDCLRDYCRAKGSTYIEAMADTATQNIFNFDKRNLDASDAAVLVMPAGKSGHLELGYMAGKGKYTYILMDGEPERFEVMHNFANAIVFSLDELVDKMANQTYTVQYEADNGFSLVTETLSAGLLS